MTASRFDQVFQSLSDQYCLHLQIAIHSLQSLIPAIRVARACLLWAVWCVLGSAAAKTSLWVQIEGLPGLSTQVAMATDPGEHRSLDDLLQAHAFQEQPNDQRANNHVPVHWLRIDLQVPQELIGSTAWMQVSPAVIWEAHLHEADGTVQRAGLSLPLNQQTHQGLPAHFKLRLSTSQVRLYLKISSALPELTQVSLTSEREMKLDLRQDALLQGLFGGASVLMVMLALINWLTTRQPIHRGFATYIASFFLCNMILNGYVTTWLLPNSPRLSASLAVVGFTLLMAQTILFSIQIMELHQRLPRLATLLKGAAYLSLAMSVLSLELTWISPLSRVLWMAHLLIGLLLLGVSLQQALALRNSLGWVVFASYLLFTVFEKTPLLSMIGLIPMYPGVVDVPKIGLLIQLLLTHLQLVLRLQNQQRLKDQADAARLETQHERDQRQGLLQFLGMFGHEVRTPLAIIDATTQSLEMLPGADGPETLHRHQRIRAAVERLTRLSHEALSRERLEACSWTPELQPVHWPYLLKSILLLQGVRVSHGGLNPQSSLSLPWSVSGTEGRLELHGFDDPPSLLADVNMLQIAINNLLDNARKYADPGSTVTMSVTSSGSDVRLQVCSQGPALSAEERDRMFDKYWRRDEHRNVAGAGLGLPLVRQVARAHKGTAEVSSQHNRWTCFSIVLPTNAS